MEKAVFLTEEGYLETCVKAINKNQGLSNLVSIQLFENIILNTINAIGIELYGENFALEDNKKGRTKK